MPDHTTLEKIAAIGKTTIDWILTGSEESNKFCAFMTSSNFEDNFTGNKKGLSYLNAKLLVDLIALVEECLRERGSPFVNARDKGWLIIDLYDRFSKSTRLSVNKDTVNSYLNRII